MSDDVGGKRQRASEEDYFRRKDRELVEKMRQASAAAETERTLGAKTGVSDPALLRELQELGFTPDTIALLPLVPVVQMAWAEGGVSPAERTLLVDLARRRGVVARSAADHQLSEWLDRRPHDDVFAKAARLIGAMLSTSTAVADFSADDVLQSAEAIAAASGGVLGIGRISGEERAILAQIQAALKQKKG